MKLGRKRENKKKMLNNYLLSIQGSEGSEPGTPAASFKKQSTIKSGFRRITVQKMEGSSKSALSSGSHSISESEMTSLKNDFVIIEDDKR